MQNQHGKEYRLTRLQMVVYSVDFTDIAFDPFNFCFVEVFHLPYRISPFTSKTLISCVFADEPDSSNE